jgi:acyl carrier protein
MKHFEEIKKALTSRGAKGAMTKETQFSDLGIDSLDLMDMIVDLEGELDITVSDEDLTNMKTINDLLTVIDKLKK